MPRIRTLKPEHRQHRKVGPLSDREYRLWVSMILEAEDTGRLVCDASQLRAVTWPYHPKVTVGHVETAIQSLACTGMIRLYEHHGVRYADFPSWVDHQRIDHPAKAKLPEYQPLANPRESSRILANDPGGREVEVEVEVEGKGSGTEGKGAHTVAAEPLERALTTDGFAEFWAAWPPSRRVGKADALKSWRALQPDPTLRQVILAAVEASKQRPDWQREGGRYIPYPHRWLGKRRWEDAPPAAQATLLTEKTAGNQAAAAAFLRRMGAT